MEAEIAKDENDGRIAKAKDRIDHYLYEKTREAGGDKRDDDPRQGEVGQGDGAAAEAQPDQEMQDSVDRMESLDSMTEAEKRVRREDDEILSRALLGKDLSEVYSNTRLRIAAERNMVNQLLKVDISEMFSPERVTSVCKKYGLVPGQAMDLKKRLQLRPGI